MASVTTTVGVPTTIEAGNEYHFTVNYADYPVGTWTAVLVVACGTGTPTSYSATTSGSDFLFQLTSAQTTTLGASATGQYQWAVYVTSSSQRATAENGILTVIPNLATARTASFAETMVATLQTVLAAFAASDKIMVDFNGQKFQRANIADYKSQFTYWKSITLAEERTRRAQRGEGFDDSRIVTEFVRV